MNDVDEVVALEHRLLDAAVRARPEAVIALLAPDFREVGASGRTWDRDGVVAALADDPSAPGVAEGVEATALAPGVVLVTYRIRRERTTARASVWVRDAAGRWRLRYHQGTPVD